MKKSRTTTENLVMMTAIREYTMIMMKYLRGKERLWHFFRNKLTTAAMTTLEKKPRTNTENMVKAFSNERGIKMTI
jgi:hypothetical protein